MIVVSSDGVKNKVKFIEVASSMVLPILTNQLKLIISEYGKERSNTSFSQLNNSFVNLVDFCYLQNKAAGMIVYAEISDFDFYFLKSFYHYLVILYEGKIAAQRYKSFRKAFTEYQKNNPELSLSFSFVKIKKTQGSITFPLPLDTICQLTKPLFYEIDEINERLSLLDSLDHVGNDIYWNELKIQILTIDYSLKNLCYRYKYHYKEDKKSRNLIYFKKNIELCPDPKISSMHVSGFIREYHENNWTTLADEGKMPRSGGMKKLQFKLADVLVTLQRQYPDYPFNTTLNELVTIKSGYQSDYKMDLYSGKIITSIDNVFDAIRYRIGGLCKKNGNSISAFVDSNINIWDEVLFKLYPSRAEVTSILLLVMIQTGWNKECALNIDLDDYIHVLNDMSESERVLIYTVKEKGQQKGKPYVEGKRIYAISNLNDKYSAVNLLKLLKKITKNLRGTSYYFQNTDNTNYSDAFICLKSESNWKSTGGLITSLSSKNVYSKAIRKFLYKYEIYEYEKRLTIASDFTERIRPTWQVLKKKLGTSNQVIQLLMGHEQSETTDIYYDSSPMASFERITRLGKELNNIEADLKSGVFKGVLIPLRVVEERKPSFKTGHIFVDNEQSNERLICICKDSSNPTFPNHELYVRVGQICKFITKCLLCKQSSIVRNSLPYIIDRLNYINDRGSYLPPLSFEELYRDEKAAIEYVLDNWPDSEDVLEAELFQIENSPLLPAMPNLYWS